MNIFNSISFSYLLLGASMALFIKTAKSAQPGDKITPLITFGPNSIPMHSNFDLVIVNDSNIGGTSHSEFSIVEESTRFNPYVKWEGEEEFMYCSLHTPPSNKVAMNDSSGATRIDLRVRSNTPEYQGFNLALASKHTVRTEHDFIAKFSFPEDAGTDWQWISIPVTSFTSDFYGNPAQPCNVETGEFCLHNDVLSALDFISINAEIVKGKFHLEIMGIYAITPSDVDGDPITLFEAETVSM